MDGSQSIPRALSHWPTTSELPEMIIKYVYSGASQQNRMFVVKS